MNDELQHDNTLYSEAGRIFFHHGENFISATWLEKKKDVEEAIVMGTLHLELWNHYPDIRDVFISSMIRTAEIYHHQKTGGKISVRVIGANPKTKKLDS